MTWENGKSSSYIISTQSWIPELLRNKKRTVSEVVVLCLLLIGPLQSPLMGLAAKQNGQFEKLKDDKIAEQEKIIELQSKLIEKKDEEPDFVKDTVPSKLKNYSSVLQGGDYGQSSQSTVGEDW